MTLITVLFDESRAALGSRNSKIGTSSRHSKKHSFLAEAGAGGLPICTKVWLTLTTGAIASPFSSWKWLRS